MFFINRHQRCRASFLLPSQHPSRELQVLVFAFFLPSLAGWAPTALSSENLLLCDCFCFLFDSLLLWRLMSDVILRLLPLSSFAFCFSVPGFAPRACASRQVFHQAARATALFWTFYFDTESPECVILLPQLLSDLDYRLTPGLVHHFPKVNSEVRELRPQYFLV